MLFHFAAQMTVNNASEVPANGLCVRGSYLEVAPYARFHIILLLYLSKTWLSEQAGNGVGDPDLCFTMLRLATNTLPSPIPNSNATHK